MDLPDIASLKIQDSEKNTQATANSNPLPTAPSTAVESTIPMSTRPTHGQAWSSQRRITGATVRPLTPSCLSSGQGGVAHGVGRGESSYGRPPFGHGGVARQSVPPAPYFVPNDHGASWRSRATQRRGFRDGFEGEESKAPPPTTSSPASRGRWFGSPPRAPPDSTMHPVFTPKDEYSTHPSLGVPLAGTSRFQKLEPKENPAKLAKLATSLGIGIEDLDGVQRKSACDDMILTKPPKPLTSYLLQASLPAEKLQDPRPLLMILDLNGTLLFRMHRGSSFIARPDVHDFLKYCFCHHKVMVWSSMGAKNVAAIVTKLFTAEQREKLIVVWSRDTLGLKKHEINTKCQTYKRLETVWDSSKVQSSHPDASSGGKWDQSNTVLVDDSLLKASKQPHNAIALPEMVGSEDNLDIAGGGKILARVVTYLEELKTYSDVSKRIRENPFREDVAVWEWTASKPMFPERVQKIHATDESRSEMKVLVGRQL